MYVLDFNELLLHSSVEQRMASPILAGSPVHTLFQRAKTSPKTRILCDIDGMICRARLHATQRRTKLCRVNASTTSLRQTHAA